MEKSTETDTNNPSFDTYNIVLDILILIIIAILYGFNQSEIASNTFDTIKRIIYLCILLSVICALILYFVKYFQNLTNSAYGSDLELFCIKDNLEYETSTFWYSFKNSEHNFKSYFIFSIYLILAFYIGWIIYQNYYKSYIYLFVILSCCLILVPISIWLNKYNYGHVGIIGTVLLIKFVFDNYEIYNKGEYSLAFKNFIVYCLWGSVIIMFYIFETNLFFEKNLSSDEFRKKNEFWIFFAFLIFFTSIAIIFPYSYQILKFGLDDEFIQKNLSFTYLLLVIISFLFAYAKSLDIFQKDVDINQKFKNIQEASGIYCLVFIVILFLYILLHIFILKSNSNEIQLVMILSTFLLIVYLSKTIVIDNIFEVIKSMFSNKWIFVCFIAYSILAMHLLSKNDTIIYIFTILSLILFLGLYYYFSYQCKKSEMTNQNYKTKLIEINLIISDIIKEYNNDSSNLITFESKLSEDYGVNEEKIREIYTAILYKDNTLFIESFSNLYITPPNSNDVIKFLSEVKNKYYKFIKNEISNTDRIDINNDNETLAYILNNPNTPAMKNIKSTILNSLKNDLKNPKLFGYSTTLNVFERDIIDRYNAINPNNKYTLSTNKILTRLQFKIDDNLYSYYVINKNKNIELSFDNKTNLGKKIKLEEDNKTLSDIEKKININKHIAEYLYTQEKIDIFGLDNLLSTYLNYFDQNKDEFKKYLYSYFEKFTSNHEMLYNKVIEFHDIKKQVKEKYDWYEKLIFAIVCILMLYIILTFVEYFSISYLNGYSINIVLLIFITLVIIILNIIIMINKLK